MLSIPTEEEFYSAASRFISGVMDEIGLQEHNIVLDQLLLPHNLFRVDNYFGDERAYSRSAATRAMCSSRTNTSGGRAITPSCSRRMRRICAVLPTPARQRAPVRRAKVLKSQFEDLIYNYDASMERIYAFLGVTKAQHSAPRTHLTPRSPSRTLSFFRVNEQYAREAEIIAELLPEYIYTIFPTKGFPIPRNHFKKH